MLPEKVGKVGLVKGGMLPEKVGIVGSVKGGIGFRLVVSR